MREEKCPKCGSDNFLEGNLYSYGPLRFKPPETVFKNTPVDSKMCLDCGAIFDLQARDFEKFRD